MNVATALSYIWSPANGKKKKEEEICIQVWAKNLNLGPPEVQPSV